MHIPEQLFQKIAKEEICKQLNKDKEYTDKYGYIFEDQLYTVWLVKTLDTNKGLFSTTNNGDGIYCEVTWGGGLDSMFVDIYKKVSNTPLSGPFLREIYDIK